MIDPGDDIANITEVLDRHGLDREGHRDHPRPYRPHRRRGQAEGAHRRARLHEPERRRALRPPGYPGLLAGNRAPIADRDRQRSARGRPAQPGRRRVPHPPHAGAHPGQHLDLDSGREQADRRRHAVPRQHRAHGPAGRRWAPDSPLDPREAAGASGDGGGDSGPRARTPPSGARKSAIRSYKVCDRLRLPGTTAALRSFDSSRRAMLDQWLEGSSFRYSVQCRTAFIIWFDP